ncbi:hypothetical protein EVAR_51970_1 [Eumeta japonica]|uniref:Uncharacterized protein n=1 Tax=Eumeta variegata TaxID=151549 RepID=A0A4C1Y5I8_EUMVA|nr:hypothetical protein EVAR_51970_1 [Eumeta japonica]
MRDPRAVTSALPGYKIPDGRTVSNSEIETASGTGSKVEIRDRKESKSRTRLRSKSSVRLKLESRSRPKPGELQRKAVLKSELRVDPES